MAVERIDFIYRLRNSVNGNPRFRIHFKGGTSAVTQSDASINYEIENPEFRHVDVEVTYSKAGRITDVRPV